MRALLFSVAVLSVAVLLTAAPAPSFADATTLQMLPPTEPNSSTICSTTKDDQQALVFNGSSATTGGAGINCVPITSDAKGDLSLQGLIQVGKDSATLCVAANAGQVRFNPSNNQFEGCNGTAWVGLMGDNASCSPAGMVPSDGKTALINLPNGFIAYIPQGKNTFAWQCQNGTWAMIGSR